MSQRSSGYARIPRDAYSTPPWVTYALIDHLPARIKTVWEPAAGEGQMVRALEAKGFSVHASDFSNGHDFLTMLSPIVIVDAIITNPPYSHAQEFITDALGKTRVQQGVVAMLLPLAYDSAKTRKHLFEYPHARKIILTQRIVWMEREDGKKAAPSENHCWHIWDWQHQGPIELYYH